MFLAPREGGRCGARVSDREGDELHLSLVLSEGRDEVGIFFGLFRDLIVGAEVSAQADPYEDEGALCLVDKRGRIWKRGIRE